MFLQNILIFLWSVDLNCLLVFHILKKWEKRLFHVVCLLYSDLNPILKVAIV